VARRLLASYVGLAILILAVLEIPLGVIAARHERSSAVSQAARVATGLAVASEEDLETHDLTGLENLLATYRAHTGAEVFVVGASGRVDAEIDPDHDADLAREPALVRAALHGRSGGVLTSDEGVTTAVAAVPIGPAGAPAGAVVLFTPAGAAADHTQDVWIALALFAAGVLVLTTLAGLALARSLSRPLAALEEAVTTFGEGELASRADAGRGPAEMRSLAQHFNRMADRLEELIEAQSRFVADASHQLRSPLTALRLRLENLEAELDPAAAESLAAAGREVQRLSRLVDGLLTLTRAGGVSAEPQPVDLDALIAERCDAWSALAAERRVELVRAPGGPRSPVASLIPGDLDQILDNLLANALDASPSGTTITVALRPGRRERVSLHVTDQGPGLSEEERRRAFDRFWQGPGRRGGHSGLGLAIVRQLAARNGLEVELLPAVGNGLDVVVHLQLRSRPHEPVGGPLARLSPGS